MAVVVLLPAPQALGAGSLAGHRHCLIKNQGFLQTKYSVTVG